MRRASRRARRAASGAGARLCCPRGRRAGGVVARAGAAVAGRHARYVGEAVELLLAHRERGGRVLVIGDFDADGATSTAVIVRALRAWGFAAVDFLVPNRFEFGYGLTPEIVALAAQREPALIVTVDNGISSHAGVAAARGARHRRARHGPSSARRRAARRQRDRQPELAGQRVSASRALAGVGVAFYVMAALHRELERGGAAAGVRTGRCRAGGTARPRRARDGRRRRAARCEQSRAGRAGAAADSRRPLRAGHPRAAGGRRTQPCATSGRGSRFRRRRRGSMRPAGSMT